MEKAQKLNKSEVLYWWPTPTSSITHSPWRRQSQPREKACMHQRTRKLEPNMPDKDALTFQAAEVRSADILL